MDAMKGRMRVIYLDNAATTYPKPEAVRRAVGNALVRYGANPGRGGHEMAMATSEQIFQCRKKIAKLFHVSGEECVAFTMNCTQSINMVLKGLLNPGDHVIVSCLEHNAVMRPLEKLKEQGVAVTIAKVFPGDDDKTVEAFRQCLKPNTKLIACTHASNVWGIRLPIERLAQLAAGEGIQIMIDAAQSAGVLPIDMEKYPIDFLCCAGHKGLYGPMGTGILATRRGAELDTLLEGGTGSNSSSLQQPSVMPDRMESGTPNTPGIIGLSAGIDFIQKATLERVASHEISLMAYLHDELSKMRHIQLYTARPTQEFFAPVLSFNVSGKASEDISQALNRHGVATRAGLHCAPLAHRYFDTLEIGTVRISPSIFNTKKQIDSVLSILSNFRN